LELLVAEIDKSELTWEDFKDRFKKKFLPETETMKFMDLK